LDTLSLHDALPISTHGTERSKAGTDKKANPTFA
jgi:hypothetical protein